MDRKVFIEAATGMVLALIINHKLFAMEKIKPEEYFFKDDGQIPNSKFPLLVYLNTFSLTGPKGGDWAESTFASNHWTNSWRWGVYPFHHFHSNTHEVLGVFKGNALLQMGGKKGREIRVKAGDILVIPAGVGHKCNSHSDDFTVVGAYPDGLSPDLCRGEPGERPKSDENIAAVPFPDTDPLLGKDNGLRLLWK